MNILELKQTFDDILPLKNFMFKSYRVDKQTNKQTNTPTNGHYWKQYHLATLSLRGW